MDTPTRGGFLLDLVFVNDSTTTVTESDSALLDCDVHHKALEISLKIEVAQNLHFAEKEYRYDFNIADYTSIIGFLNSISWDQYLSSPDVNTMVSDFYSVLYYAVNMFVPKKPVFHSTYPSWFSKELINCIKKKRNKFTCFTKK